MDTKEVMQCGHCKRKAEFALRAEGYKYGASFSLPQLHTFGLEYDGIPLTKWRILECTLCREPTIEQIFTDYSFDVGMNGEVTSQLLSADKTILYPRPSTPKPLTNLPKLIEKEYEATLQVRDISLAACAVLARRTLEAIFSYEKAQGGTLAEKVNNLLKSDRIPSLVAEMAHLGRKIGNMGAHVDEGEVTEEDVAFLLGFLEAILEYLYVAPAKIAAVQTRLKKTP